MNGLRGTLDLLISASLVRQVSSEAEPAFRFRHTLDQQTAYHSILRSDREKIHKLVGEVLERGDPLEAAAQPSVLAEHFAMGGDSRRALKYYALAADQAGRVYAHTEAIDFYDRALDLADGLNEPAEQLRELLLKRGRTLELMGDYLEAMQNYRRLEAEGHARGDASLELAGITRQTTLLAAPSDVSDPQAGHALALRCLELAQSVGDQESQARAHWSLVLTGLHLGHLTEARSEGEIGLQMARELGLDELLAFIANDLSALYISEGSLGRGQELLEEAIEIWRRVDNLPMLVDSLTNLTGGLILNGEYDLALKNYVRARQIADRIDNRWAQAYSSFFTEVIYAERGQLDQALAISDEQIRLGAEAGFKVPSVVSNAFRAWLFSYLGVWEAALAAADDAVRASRQIGGPLLLGTQAVRAMVCAQMGDFAEAERTAASMEAVPMGRDSLLVSPIGPYYSFGLSEYLFVTGQHPDGLAVIGELIDREIAGSFHFLLSSAFELKARLLRASGDPEGAREALDLAQTEAEYVASRRMCWIIHAERANWLEADGQGAQANRERALARPDFEFVVSHLGDPQLREAFLASPRVKALKMA